MRYTSLLISAVLLSTVTGCAHLSRRKPGSDKAGTIILSGVLDDHYSSDGAYLLTIKVNGRTLYRKRKPPFKHGTPHGAVFTNWKQLELQLPQRCIEDKKLVLEMEHNGSDKRDWIGIDFIGLERGGYTLEKELSEYSNYGAEDGAADILYGGESQKWEVDLVEFIQESSLSYAERRILSTLEELRRNQLKQEELILALIGECAKRDEAQKQSQKEYLGQLRDSQSRQEELLKTLTVKYAAREEEIRRIRKEHLEQIQLLEMLIEKRTDEEPAAGQARPREATGTTTEKEQK